MSNDSTKRETEWFRYELPHGEPDWVWYDLGTIEMRQAREDLSRLRHAVIRWSDSGRANAVTIGTQSQVISKLREELAESRKECAELQERVLFYRELSNKRDERLAELETRVDALRKAIESVALGGS